MADEKNNFQQAQQGSGSAEQTGRSRDAQQNKGTDLSQNERQDIASEIGEDENKIAGVRQMGGMSGRDDSSGGENSGMRNESTGEATDR